MTLNWSSRAIFQSILLFSLSQLATSVSLQDLSFHASALDLLRPGCNLAYKETIPDCTNDDFTSGCSDSCVQGVMKAVDDVTKQCSSLFTPVPVPLPVPLPVPIPLHVHLNTNLNSKEVVGQLCPRLANVGTTSTTSASPTPSGNTSSPPSASSASGTSPGNTSPTSSVPTTSSSSSPSNTLPSGTSSAAASSTPASAFASEPTPQQSSILISTNLPSNSTLTPLILPNVSPSSSSFSTIIVTGTFAPFPVTVHATSETSTLTSRHSLAPSPSESSPSSSSSEATTSTTSSLPVQASMEPKTLPPIDNPQAEFSSKTSRAGGVIAAVAGSLSGSVLIAILVVFGCLYRRQRLRTLRPLYSRHRPATENLTFLRYQPPASSFYSTNVSGVVFPSRRPSMPMRRDTDPFHPFRPFRPTSRPSPLFPRQVPPQYGDGVRISLTTSDFSFNESVPVDHDSPFRDPMDPFRDPELPSYGREDATASNRLEQTLPPLPTPGGASSSTETSTSTTRMWELLGDARWDVPGTNRGGGHSV